MVSQVQQIYLANKNQPNVSMVVNLLLTEGYKIKSNDCEIFFNETNFYFVKAHTNRTTLRQQNKTMFQEIVTFASHVLFSLSFQHLP